MYTYEQASGRFAKEGTVIATGYSGFGLGQNNSLYEPVPNVGPIPRGAYIIGSPYNSDSHGPVVLPLIAKHAAFGRNGFLIHGDSTTAPGQASHGCLILDRPTRELIAVGEDHDLMVL